MGRRRIALEPFEHFVSYPGYNDVIKIQKHSYNKKLDKAYAVGREEPFQECHSVIRVLRNVVLNRLLNFFLFILDFKPVRQVAILLEADLLLLCTCK